MEKIENKLGRPTSEQSSQKKMKKNLLEISSKLAPILLLSFISCEILLTWLVYSDELLVFFAVTLSILLVSFGVAPLLFTFRIIHKGTKKSVAATGVIVVIFSILLAHTSLLGTSLIADWTEKNKKRIESEVIEKRLQSEVAQAMSRKISEKESEIKTLRAGGINNEISVILSQIKEKQTKIKELDQGIKTDLEDFWRKKTNGFLNSSVTSASGIPKKYNGQPMVTRAKTIYTKYLSLKSNHPNFNKIKQLSTQIIELKNGVERGKIIHRIENEVIRIKSELAMYIAAEEKPLLDYLAIPVFKIFFIQENPTKREIYKTNFLPIFCFFSFFMAIYFFATTQKNEMLFVLNEKQQPNYVIIQWAQKISHIPNIGWKIGVIIFLTANVVLGLRSIVYPFYFDAILALLLFILFFEKIWGWITKFKNKKEPENPIKQQEKTPLSIVEPTNPLSTPLQKAML